MSERELFTEALDSARPGRAGRLPRPRRAATDAASGRLGPAAGVARDRPRPCSTGGRPTCWTPWAGPEDVPAPEEACRPRRPATGTLPVARRRGPTPSAGSATTRYSGYSAAAGFGVVVKAHRRDPAAGRGHQGPRPAPGRHLPAPQALPARGPGGRPGAARERRADLRRRGAAAALPGDGVHRRADAAAAARRDRPARPGGGGAARPADRPGAGGRPRPGADPPRREAGQHPARGGRRAAGQADRLRAGPGGRRRQPDPERGGRRHPDVHGPGAGRGRGRGPRADLFSLGSVLYTMAAGRPAVPGGQHVRRPRAGGRGHPAAAPAR